MPGAVTFAVGDRITVRTLTTAHYYRDLPPGERVRTACGMYIRLDRGIVAAPAGMRVCPGCAKSLIGRAIAEGRPPVLPGPHPSRSVMRFVRVPAQRRQRGEPSSRQY